MNRISLILLVASFIFSGQYLFAIVQTPVPLCRNVSIEQIDIERCAQEILDYYDVKYVGDSEGGIISRNLLMDKYMEMIEGLFITSYDPFCLQVEAKVDITQNDCNGDEVDFSWDMETPDQIDLKYLNLHDGSITDKMSTSNRLNILFDDCAFDKLYAYNIQCGNGKSGVDVIIIIDADIATGGDGRPGGNANGRPTGHPNPDFPYQGNFPDNATSLSFSLAPNPVSDTPTQLQITTAKTQNSIIQIEVHNTLGKRMYNTTQEVLPNNTQTQSLPTTNLPTGLYFVTLRSGDKQITQRLVKR